ncbi:hypothetical protein IFT63_11100 [Stenotrophomonas sp. CFBP 13724]|uniref:hypothetical protein n=1 Tax=Stenotrophomonas sp. CFBP 13724 TaxID=2775298 RepID=UPI001782A9DA|nr:hypothetical protein [Stenotrophomonas sp. CFBP 13724]MBD8644130.1 hypothetical protein [Stenotrophomonas sp. CFBP 13724]
MTAIAGGEQAFKLVPGLKRPWGTLSPLRIQIPCSAFGALILSQPRSCRGLRLDGSPALSTLTRSIHGKYDAAAQQCAVGRFAEFGTFFPERSHPAESFTGRCYPECSKGPVRDYPQAKK